MQEMPEKITVTKTVVYDVKTIIDQIKEFNAYEPTYNEIIETVVDFAKTDFSCSWGHEADVDELVFKNEKGETVW